MDAVIETLIRVIYDKASNAMYGLELINAVLEQAMDLLRDHAQFIGRHTSVTVKVPAAHGFGLGHSVRVEAGKGQVDPPQIFGWVPEN